MSVHASHVEAAYQKRKKRDDGRPEHELQEQENNQHHAERLADKDSSPYAVRVVYVGMRVCCLRATGRQATNYVRACSVQAFGGTCGHKTTVITRYIKALQNGDRRNLWSMCRSDNAIILWSLHGCSVIEPYMWVPGRRPLICNVWNVSRQPACGSAVSTGICVRGMYIHIPEHSHNI